jgi:hypothetical protein
LNSLSLLQGYINMLTQIVETMNYTPDVEKFLEVSVNFLVFKNNFVGGLQPAPPPPPLKGKRLLIF